MGFFDDVVGKAKNAVNVMGKNAGNLVDSSKLKFHAAELKGDIQKSYEALGKLIYEANKNGTDATEATAQAVAAIDELYEQMAAIEAQLLKLNNKIVCSNCGEKSENSASFCPKCGAKLEHEVPVEQECSCGCDCGCDEETAQAAPETNCGCGCSGDAATEEKKD